MKSNCTTEVIEPTLQKLNITIDPESVDEVYSAIQLDLQKTSEVKGFRKGKVPLALVQKIFADDIIKKTKQKLVEESYQEAIQSLDLKVVNTSFNVPEELVKSNPFIFEVTVDVVPLVEIKDYKEISVKPFVWENTLEEEVEKNLNTFREAQQKHAETQKSQDKNEHKHHEHTAEYNHDHGHDHAHEVTPFDDNMVEKYKEFFHSEVQKERKAKDEQVINDQILDEIISKNEIPFPQKLIDNAMQSELEEIRYSKEYLEKITDIHALEKEYPEDYAAIHTKAQREVKTVLLLGHIARQEKIEVANTEVTQALIEIAQKNPMQAKNLFKGTKGYEIMQRVQGQLLLEKVMAYLRDINTKQ